MDYNAEFKRLQASMVKASEEYEKNPTNSNALKKHDAQKAYKAFMDKYADKVNITHP